MCPNQIVTAKIERDLYQSVQIRPQLHGLRYVSEVNLHIGQTPLVTSVQTASERLSVVAWASAGLAPFAWQHAIGMLVASRACRWLACTGGTGSWVVQCSE
jgi:hypothetical protein